jgi:beta-lactam-binding protein with PASTA domain
MKYVRIAWVVPFLLFLFGYIGTYLFLQQESIVTPNVIGKSLQEAVVLLSKQRLGVRLVREQEDSSIPEGTIMDQIPRSNNKIRPNQNIFVTISKKPSLFLAPTFLGCNIKDIQAKSFKGDIDLLGIHCFGEYSANICFAQYPKPGQLLSRKFIVAYVSRGSFPLYIVPNFKGLSVSQVKDFLRLEDGQLEIVHLQEVLNSHTCVNCYVIDQRPIAGSIISLDKPFQIQVQVGSCVDKGVC